MGRRRKTPRATRTVVAIIQDKSGSMYNRCEATIDGYNEYITSLQRAAEGEMLLSLTQFDTSVKQVYSARPLMSLSTFSHEDYCPGGGTALYDAIGRTIREMEPAVRKDDNVLVVIMTDGQENSSNEWNKDGVLKLLEDKRKIGWEFVFLGAGEESWNAGVALGFDHNHSINYGVDAHDHQSSYGVLVGTTNSVLRGQTAESYLSTSTVKQSLEHKAKNEATPDWAGDAIVPNKAERKKYSETV